eukprot:403331584
MRKGIQNNPNIDGSRNGQSLSNRKQKPQHQKQQDIDYDDGNNAYQEEENKQQQLRNQPNRQQQYQDKYNDKFNDYDDNENNDENDFKGNEIDTDDEVQQQNQNQKEELEADELRTLRKGLSLELQVLLSWISYSKVSIPVLNFTGLLGLKTLLTGVLGYYTSHRFEQALYLTQKLAQQNRETPTLPNNELQRQFIYFYSTLLFAILYLSAGIMCLFMQNQHLSFVKAYLFDNEAYDKNNQLKQGYRENIADQQDYWISILNSNGVVCLLASVTSLSLSVNAFSVSRKYEFYHMSNQFMNLIQIGLACTILVYLSDINQYWSHYELSEYIRYWPLSGMFYLCTLIIMMTIGQWFAIYKDRIHAMQILGSVQMIAFLLIFIFSFFTLSDIKDYQNEFKCYESMHSINMNDFSLLQCKHKYTMTAKSIPELSLKSNCTIDATRLVWEDQNSEDFRPETSTQNVGCLNDMCCDATLQYVRAKFDYLIYLCILIGILGIVNYTTLVALMTFLQIYVSKRLNHGYQEKIIAILVCGAPIVALFYMIVLLPKGPTYMSNLGVGQIDELVRPTLIEDRYLEFNGYFDIFDIIIREDRRPCGIQCKDLDYLINLEVNKGVLRLNPSFDKSTISITQNSAVVDQNTKTQGYQLQFKGNLYDVNAALDLFEYKPACPFDTDNSLNVKITAYPKNGDYGSGQIVSADMGDSITVNGRGEHLILQKKLSYVFDKKDDIKVQGRAVIQTGQDTYEPIKSESLSMSSNLFQVKTDENGSFIFTLPQITGNKQYPLEILITSTMANPSFQPFLMHLTIGGIFQFESQLSTKTINLGNMLTTFITGSKINYRDENVQVQVKNGQSLKPLKQATLNLKEGLDPTVEKDALTKRSELTDEQGLFKFLKLQNNFYSIFASKQGFYDDSIRLLSVGNQTKQDSTLYMLPFYENSQGSMWIRMQQQGVLNQNTSLALHMIFKTDKQHTCFVSYLEKECGGVSYYGDFSSQNNFESLKFKQYGSNYTYLLAVSALQLNNQAQKDTSNLFTNYDPQISLVIGANSTSQFRYDINAPTQNAGNTLAKTWIVGCFKSREGIQRFNFLNILNDQELLKLQVTDYC